MAGHPEVESKILFEIATYLANPLVETDIHAELPHRHRLRFEQEYDAATGGFPLPQNGRRYPYYVWPEGTNKRGRQLRIYLNKVAPAPPPINDLITDFGVWHARKNKSRINHSKLVMQLFECGFVLGNIQDVDRIERFMSEQFPVA